jgi:poly-gamma-glutamate synthesis protein (capsule biosynthesis protein)
MNEQEPGISEIQNSAKPERTGKSQRRKKLLVVLFVVVFVAVAALITYRLLSNDESETTVESTAEAPVANEEKAPKDDYVRILATGDMIPHDALNASAKQADSTYDYLQFMDNMKPVFDTGDVNFCNQAVLGAGVEFGITGYPVFNSPIEFSQDMNKVGCNLINTGSNHTNDLGQAEIDASRAVWDDLDVLAVAGSNRSEEEKNKIAYFDVDGVKFAFLSYVTYSNTAGETNYGITTYSDAFAQSQITEAKKNADIAIVSMRWGTEYSPKINADQDSISQKLADYGADIVLGHGPHVLEPVKKLSGSAGNTTYVWYSLGNFLNAQLESETLFNGFAVMDIDIESKQVSSIGYLPLYMHYEWTAEQKAQEELNARSGFEMYLLEDAAKPLANSQLDTTIEAQTKRISQTLNTYTKVPLLSSQDVLQ